MKFFPNRSHNQYQSTGNLQSTMMSASRSSIEADSTDAASESDIHLEIIYDDAADTASIAATMASHVNKYKYVNGRRYHSYKEGSWPVPNDETQQDQMDLFHEVFTRAKHGRLYLSPLEGEPRRILDLGCGTGIWTMQCADRHPKTEVIGNDLSPIQPNWWVYQPSTFDLIHARGLHVAVKDWSLLCREAYKALKPGGYLEVCSELAGIFCDDNTLPADSVINTWLENAHKAVAKLDRPIENHDIIEDCMKDAGFDMSTFQQIFVKVPLGTWPRDKRLKELGALNLCNLLSGVEGFSLTLYMTILGWEEAAFKEHIEDIKRALKDKRSRMYMRIHTSYAQKPHRARSQ